MRMAYSGCIVRMSEIIHSVGRWILTWPSSLYELSFSNCDNRKSHPRAHGKKNAHCAGSLRITTSARSSCSLSGPGPSCWSHG
jgi:hypothetical protein